MMGYYPKHLHQRRHRQFLKRVAIAALAGCRFERAKDTRRMFTRRWAATCSCGSPIGYSNKADIALLYTLCLRGYGPNDR